MDEEEVFHKLLIRLVNSNGSDNDSIDNDQKDLIILYNLTKSNEIRDYNWITTILYNNNNSDNITYNIYNIIFILIKKYWNKIITYRNTNTYANDNIINNEMLLMKIWIMIQSFPEYDNDYAINTSTSTINDNFVDILFQRLLLLPLLQLLLLLLLLLLTIII